MATLVTLYAGLLHLLVQRYHNTKSEFHWRQCDLLADSVTTSHWREEGKSLLLLLRREVSPYLWHALYCGSFSYASIMSTLWGSELRDRNRRLYFLSPHFSHYATQILNIKCPYEHQTVNEATPNSDSKSYSNKGGYKTTVVLPRSHVSSNKTYSTEKQVYLHRHVTRIACTKYQVMLTWIFN